MYKHMLTKKHVGQCEDVKTGERVRLRMKNGDGDVRSENELEVLA